MEVLKETWRFRPPPENVVILEMCKHPENCLFGNACTKAHSLQELDEWKIRISLQINEQKKSLVFQSQINSIRNFINENRRQGLPQRNLVSKQKIFLKLSIVKNHCSLVSLVEVYNHKGSRGKCIHYTWC